MPDGPAWYWSDWIEHDHRGNPIPVGFPIIVEIEGIPSDQPIRANTDGPWWHGGRLREGNMIHTSPRIMRYRYQRWPAAAALIERISRGEPA